MHQASGDLPIFDYVDGFQTANIGGNWQTVQVFYLSISGKGTDIGRRDPVNHE